MNDHVYIHRAKDERPKNTSKRYGFSLLFSSLPPRHQEIIIPFQISIVGYGTSKEKIPSSAEIAGIPRHISTLFRRMQTGLCRSSFFFSLGVLTKEKEIILIFGILRVSILVQKIYSYDIKRSKNMLPEYGTRVKCVQTHRKCLCQNGQC